MNEISYERLKERYTRLLGSRCRRCGREYFPKVAVCRRCGSFSLEDAKMPEQGELISFTTLNVKSREFSDCGELVIGIVQLDNGVNLLSQIVSHLGKDAIKIGARVKLQVERLKDGSEFMIYKFAVL